MKERNGEDRSPIVLGVETSSLDCGVALAEGGRVMGELLSATGEPASERLVQFIEVLLKQSDLGIDDLSGFAVSIGPGSFTGLRVGLSTIKGLCHSTSKPLVRVPTLDALAFAVPYCHYVLCPMLDARRGEVYAAFYQTGSGELQRLTPYLALTPSELLKRVEEDTVFLGSGVDAYREQIVKTLEAKAHFVTPNPPTARASSVAVIGAVKLLKGETEEPDGVEPLYLRPSQAELKLKETHG